MPWAVSLSLGDAKLFLGPKHNIYAFFMILIGFFDLILLFVCQICQSVKFVKGIVKQKIENKQNIFLKKADRSYRNEWPLKNGPNPTSFILIFIIFKMQRQLYYKFDYNSINGVLGTRTRAAGWKAQTNPLSYAGNGLKYRNL